MLKTIPLVKKKQYIKINKKGPNKLSFLILQFKKYTKIRHGVTKRVLAGSLDFPQNVQ